MAAVARACQADGGCYLFWNALAAQPRRAAPSTARIGAREEPVVTLSLQPDALRSAGGDDLDGALRCHGCTIIRARSP